MIRLTLRSEPPVRISLGGIIPEMLAGSSEEEIARRPLFIGRHRERLGDWFTIRCTGSIDELVLEGQCRRVDHIGTAMSRGTISVVGEAGAYLGMEMRGGRITVEGTAGYGVATAMQGGEIRIGGNVGDLLGGALPGERHGMSGGLVAVAGSAGVKCGDRLRRGSIVVMGDTAELCGSRMFAGTIVVGGYASSHPGMGMQRGSIVVLDGCDTVAPSFVDCGIQDLVLLKLLAQTLASNGFRDLARRVRPLRRWRGDGAVLGRGEIFAAD